MACTPQPGAFLFADGPAELSRASLGRDLLDHFRLFDHCPLGHAVKLEEQRRCNRVVQLRVAIHRVDLHLIEELDASDWDPELDRGDDRRNGTLERRKRADGRRDRLGQPVQAQRDLRHDAQGAFGADEETSEVVAGGGLARARSGLNDATVGEDDGEPQHGLAHRPISHGGGAGRACRRHAADRAVGSGVDEERQPVLSEVGVELTMGDAGFDSHIEIFRAESHDPVHAGHVDRHPSVERPDVTLEGGAGAKRDDRRTVPGANPHDARHVVGRLREDHDVGSVRSAVRLAVAVMIRTAAATDTRSDSSARRSATSGSSEATRLTELAPGAERGSRHNRSRACSRLLSRTERFAVYSDSASVREQLMYKNTRRDAVI